MNWEKSLGNYVFGYGWFVLTYSSHIERKTFSTQQPGTRCPLRTNWRLDQVTGIKQMVEIFVVVLYLGDMVYMCKLK